MRLLYVLSDRGIPLASTRGSAVHARSLLGALAANGHQVGAIVRRLEGSEPVPEGVEILAPGVGKRARDLRKKLKSALSDVSPRSSLPSEAESILYNERLAGTGLELLAEAPPDAVVERLSLFGTAGLSIARALGVPFLLEVNAPLTEEARRYRRLELGGLASEMEEKVLRGADAVLAVSDGVREWAVGRGALPERVHVVENGVDTERFRPDGPVSEVRRQRGVGDAFLVGFAGSLKPWHGVEVLVEALARLVLDGRDVHLLLVGEGPLRESLQALAVRYFVPDRVHLSGNVPHAQVPELLRACDVLAAPYPPLDEFYFSPLKVLEYLALGRPVVASRIGPIPGWARDGQDALLVPPGDVSALAAAIARLESNPDLADHLASSAPSRVKGRSWRDVAARLVRIAGECGAGREAAEEAAGGLG